MRDVNLLGTNLSASSMVSNFDASNDSAGKVRIPVDLFVAILVLCS